MWSLFVNTRQAEGHWAFLSSLLFITYILLLNRLFGNTWNLLKRINPYEIYGLAG